MERDQWKFPEATTNVFTLYGLDKMLGMDIKLVVKQKIAMPPFFYVAAYWIDRFGWDSFKTFFSNYEIDIANSNNLAVTDQDKIDQWTVRYSRIVGGNVRLHFEAFQIQPNETFVDAQLAGLELLDTNGMLNISDMSILWI